MSISVVSPTQSEPQFDVTLTDGTTVVGFNVCNEVGKHIDYGITATPLDRTAIKTTQGGGTYDDLILPYKEVVQSDWSGGRAWEDFDSDSSRYYDGQAVDTWHEGVTLGGLPTYATGYRGCNQDMPGSVTWVTMSTTQDFMAASFAASSTFLPRNVEVLLKKVGSPGDLLATLYNNSTDVPAGTPFHANSHATISSSAITDTTANLYKVTFASAVSSGFVSGSTYWIKLECVGTNNSSNYWKLGMCSTGANTTKKSTDDTAWTAASNGMFYRITEEDSDFVAHFFDYKGNVYFAAIKDSSGFYSQYEIYRNGFRGVADDNSAAKTKLTDSTQSWTTDALIGSIAEIFDGNGSNEYQRWRAITANNSTSATVSPAWDIDHYATTQDATLYNILGTSTFAKTSSGSSRLKDLVVAGDIMYFVSGTSKYASYEKYMGKYREYLYIDPDTLATSWVVESTTQGVGRTCGDYLESIYDPNSNQNFLYVARNNDASGDVLIEPFPINNMFEDNSKGYKTYATNSTKGFMQESRPISDITVTSIPPNYAILVVSSSFSTGLICTDIVNTEDWRDVNNIDVRIKCNKTMAAGELQFVIDDTAKCASTIKAISFPAMKANQWYGTNSWGWDLGLSAFQNLDLSSITGMNAVISVGLNLTVDPTVDVTIAFQLRGVWTGKPAVNVGDNADKITNLIAYGDPKVLHILKEGSIWRYENGLPYQLPIDDMKAIKSYINGRGVCVGDVYLWFNTGSKGGIQRYFNQAITSVGLNLDAGLPDGRQGPVVDMVGYPGGQIFAAVDAGSSGTSAVFVYHNSGWHEVYRAPRAGERIRKLHIQALPDGTRRLWISQGSDVLWIPISDNPYRDSAYRYIWESVLESGWHYCNLADVKKQFKSLALFTENAAASAQTIEADYKTDESSTWTPMNGVFDVSPSEEVTFSSSTPANVSAKRIKYRLRMQTNSNLETPKIKASVMRTFAVVPSKYSYSWIARLSEGDRSKDLQGDEVSTLGEYATVELALAALTSWANNATALTMNSKWSIFDSKTVLLNPITIRSLRNMAEDQVEEHAIAISLLES